MLHHTLSIVEKTLDQLRMDRDSITAENRQLKLYLTAKDIHVDFDQYKTFVKQSSHKKSC
jgi:hypothetical protein